MSEAFEILEHTADIGFRAWGETPAKLFENAARAMMSIATDVKTVNPQKEMTVETRGEDYESLLVNWLSEILYLFDAGEFAPRDFHVDAIEPTKLRGTLAGEPRDPARHRWDLIIKAVTYHEIRVTQLDGRWEAQVFVDI